jgi:hypothetical protein
MNTNTDMKEKREKEFNHRTRRENNTSLLPHPPSSAPHPFAPTPRSFSRSVVFTLLLALAFAACSVDIPEEEGFIVKLRVYGDDGTKYYSLAAGGSAKEEITGADIASQKWDLAVEAHDGTFFVLTNSGASAVRAGSGGQGGVWHTGQFAFERTGFNHRVTGDLGVLADYTADQKRYAMVMSDVAEEYLNVMTYLGYPDSGNAAHNGKTKETHFKRKEPDETGMASYVPYLFNQKQFYTMRGMPPNYTPTYQVYIVRHGNGTGYSKVQINEVYLEYDSKVMSNSVFVLKIRHEKF